MKRRNFLVGVGGTAIGASALVGSGAFTSVEADRDISVEVVGDAEAYLALKPHEGPNGAYAEENDDGMIELHFDEDADTEGGSGISDRATWIFDEVIKATNNGTQGIVLGVDYLDADGDRLGGPGEVGVGGPVLRLDEGGPGFASGYPVGDCLGTGDSVDIGVFFNLAKDEDFGDVVEDLETMVIVAEPCENGE